MYEIGRQFCNEGMSVKHNPEFTTIELYESVYRLPWYDGYHREFNQCLCTSCLWKRYHYVSRGRSQSAKPFRRLTMIEAVKEYTGVDFDAFVGDNEKAHAVAKELNLPVEKHHVWGDILNLAFEEK